MPTSRRPLRIRTLVRHASVLSLLLAGAGAVAHGNDAGAPAAKPAPYDPVATAGRRLGAGDVTIDVLLDAATLGGADLEVAELTLPAGYAGSGPHAHRRLEILYVLEGTLGHEVNGQMHELGAGGIGHVRPGDTVVHSVRSPGPVRALIIWLPGGEARDLVEHAGFTERPVP